MSQLPIPLPNGGDPSDFVGRGISFPLRVDSTGSIAMTSGADDITASLTMVLSTAPGERLMRPEFGCKIWQLLFEPINANTLGLMGEAVREAVARWEPRVDLTDLRVEPVAGSVGEVRIELDYTVRVTNDRRNLVYPFYVIPHEGDEPQQQLGDTSAALGTIMHAHELTAGDEGNMP